ncbi:MAG: hypothetical protein OXN90_03525 [Gemmatimonadota bacterium]|nr:hypothetical protein [Gemmatimonadota bacterium]
MGHWNFEWWHFLTCYCMAFIFIDVIDTLQEIGIDGSLIVLAVFLVLFYYARKKKTTPQGGSAMNCWNFEWWRIFALYFVGFITINGVMAIIEKKIGVIGAYLIILAMCLVASLFYHARRENATDAS